MENYLVERLPIIIDCDPGQDDAIALLLAMAPAHELEILGITTVAGNVRLDLTTRNARLMCDIASRDDIAVYAGCDKPLKRQLVTAEKVHGLSGIGGIKVVEPRAALGKIHAVDFITKTLQRAVNVPVTLVLMGPLTNIATAFEMDPSITAGIAEIVLMG
ncbi:MAG TPA: nucleoside hydrolase, partial [Gammaproteobacteria bacterium]|nr:nucleoside hydrolase [Gammaproteobacteria bacterium]